MTLQELNIELSNALKKYIKDRDHIRTGALYRSVIFNCEDNGELIIKFDAKFYIKYLELRQFVPDFFNLQSTNDIIQRYVVAQLSNIMTIKK